ncbi:hypothetical protein BH10PSE16_BH10PSE16_04180 [soil metagenome]
MSSYLLSSQGLPTEVKSEQSYFSSDECAFEIMKNADRIDEIACTMSVVKKEVLLMTNPISRTIRRDWNIVSAKMYVFGLKRDHRALIEEDLTELHHQIDELYKIASMGMFSDVDTSWLNMLRIEVKIISAQSSSWLRAMKIWDVCVARLLTAERMGLIDRKQRKNILYPVTMAYLGFKNTAMRGKGQNVREVVVQSSLI